MSRFLKPADYNDDEDKPCLIKAKPIGPKFARKLGSYGAGKDFVTGSVKSQQELRENNIIGNDTNASEMIDEKARLEQRNKLGAKILKAKLQGKTDLVEKLEKELYALREDEQGPSSVCKILLKTAGGGVQIPAIMKQEGKDLKTCGKINAIYHADESVRDMIAGEKATISSDHIFSTVKAAAKHRADEDWVVDDMMMAVKRSRKNEEKERRRSRNNLIKGKVVFALLLLRIFDIPDVTGKDPVIIIIITSYH
ncbi:unnamed protein product [Onchocerca ochengi]|uniref:G-patch_2 domain-containing protein n=2 Tax=Onchocerca TaxID=6281 RepID=A0A182E7E3_ONCOC|nr:unnamed protein product [Onchocerca ochengi]VDK71786.1 unnamed protein product [Onchocerca ochengi]